MEDTLDPEEKIMCPYNPSHYIRRCRMNTHLVKCKKSYPEAKLVECDFNVNHKVPEPELQYHHENCRNRPKLEIKIYEVEGDAITKYPIRNIDIVSEEGWDDLDVPSYDAKAYCEKSEVLRHVEVESGTKRKNFRSEERKRVSQLTMNKPAEVPQPRSYQHVMENRSTASQRDLPETSSCVIEEDTPESIAKVMERINVGKNRSFFPKLE